MSEGLSSYLLQEGDKAGEREKHKDVMADFSVTLQCYTQQSVNPSSIIHSDTTDKTLITEAPR